MHAGAPVHGEACQVGEQDGVTRAQNDARDTAATARTLRAEKLSHGCCGAAQRDSPGCHATSRHSQQSSQQPREARRRGPRALQAAGRAPRCGKQSCVLFVARSLAWCCSRSVTAPLFGKRSEQGQSLQQRRLVEGSQRRSVQHVQHMSVRRQELPLPQDFAGVALLRGAYRTRPIRRHPLAAGQ